MTDIKKQLADQRVNQKYQTILLYEQGLINSKTAANSLNVSERQCFRILKTFKKSGRDINGLKYHSHIAWNKTDKDIQEKILQLNKDCPSALNSHLSWLVWDVYGLEIKPATIRNILIDNNCYVPFKQKQERAYKKFQATHFGALVQMDTADGYWLKNYSMLHLIIDVDDASRTILGGGIYESDSTLNNMVVIKQTIRKYGIPALFYTDNDSKFKVIRHGKSNYQTYKQKVLDGQAMTEIRRALMEVGSGLITHFPYHPQGKGKVEKLIDYVQNCFLKNHRASNLKELNDEFKRWIRWYDKRNHRGLGEAPYIARERLIKQGKTAFKPLDDKLDLDIILSVKDQRKPNKCNVFHYKGKEYQLPLDKVMYPGKIELRIMPDNKIRVFNPNKQLIAEFKNN